MEYRQLGNTDMCVSTLGFGGVEINGTCLGNVKELLNNALDAGLNTIDTAECYGNSEELIGQAIGDRRNEFYLFTKCGHSAGFDIPDWTPRLLEQTIDRSLQRLKTDYVDLILLHTCTEELLRRGEVIEVVQRARDAGKTRYIGYSGDDQAALYAVQIGLFDVLETSVSIADQQAIDLTLPLTIQHGIGVIAKRPVANAVWRTGTKPKSSYQHSYWDRLQALQYDFLGGDLVTSFDIALRFTLSVPGVHTAIVGTANPKRWLQNADSVNRGPLPKEQYDAIRARWRQVAQGRAWAGER